LSKDSLDLTIKILPIKRGLFNDTIRIPYHNGTAIDTLKIPVKCEIFDTEFSDGYEILQFPAISESENYKDTTLTLYNKTEIALNIKITPIITDVVFSGVPAAIDPGDSAVVGIRLMPSSYGDLEYDFNFVEELCGETHPLKILGSRYGNFYRFDRDSVDFGTIYNCGPTNPVVNNINLFAKTTTKDTIRIISVEISSPFTVNINAGDILKDTNNLIITFPDCPDGDYTGYLKLKIDPGSKELMLPLKGSRHTTSVDLLNKIDFGRLDIGDSVIKILALHNSGKVPVKFSGILSIPAPFYIINPVDSIFLNPDQTFEYQIGYYPTIEAADSISIFLDMTDPCQSTFRVDLTGSAKINNLKGLTFTLPQITAKPDEIISLPVTLQSDGNIAGNLSVESLLMKISYNPTLFFPIFADTTSINLQNGAKISEFKEIKPGIFSVRVDFTNPSGITNGTLFNLTGRAMEGNDSSTALTYDSIQIIPDNKVPITKNDGLLKLNSHFLTDLNGNFNISLASGNPTTGRAVLSIEVPSDGQSKLSLINFEGGEILSFPKEYLKKGKNEIILDMTQNSPGVYLAVIWFGQNVKILKIVYIRD
jgi:hypothetical protein